LRLRLVLVGNFGVGKSSLLRQYLDRSFVDAPSNTVQEDERETTFAVDGEVCEVGFVVNGLLWSTDVGHR
jgi:GTPase SAR1 family protein